VYFFLISSYIVYTLNFISWLSFDLISISFLFSEIAERLLLFYCGNMELDHIAGVLQRVEKLATVSREGGGWLRIG
jgi:hypothetical protein